ncbi:sugar transferase [Hungatella effluvii]|uniref:sugar transferase n=1 Tax=Hungatella effluvii TaxID=1096246 RepID=UPI0022E6439C|nr:sugar transferase [Hungatella effluvii]
MRHKPYGIYEKDFKRPLDLFCGLAAVIVFWWLYLVVAVLVRIKLGSPVLYTQNRPGKNEKIFKLYKFRTMMDERDENGELLPDEVRLTKFGKCLRNTSLDELPEVFNIIRGDMSIVGPRPLLVRYLPYYTEEEHHRHDIRPGLTGLAQVKGRNFITWEEIFQYDLEYANHCTFVMDIKILIYTVLKVISHSDISDATQGTQDSSGRKVHDSLDIERKVENAS